MSKAIAKKYLDTLITQYLEDSTARQTAAADITYTIIDKKTIASANRVSYTSKSFSEDYEIFIGELNKQLGALKPFNTTAEAIKSIASGNKYAKVVISDILYIFCRNYNALADLRTDIARAIPNNKNFGLFRRRTQLTPAQLASSKNLSKHEGSCFIKEHKSSSGKYGVYEVIGINQPDTDITVYKLEPHSELGNFTHYIKEKPEGGYTRRIQINKEVNGVRVRKINNTVEVHPSHKDTIVLDDRYESLQQLGHVESKTSQDQDTYGFNTVLGRKIGGALEVLEKGLVLLPGETDLSSTEIQKLKNILLAQQKKLAKLHSRLKYDFQNKLPEVFNNVDLAKILGSEVGIVGVLFQGIDINVGVLSVKEKEIFAKTVELIKKNLDPSTVAGSNTLKQDLQEAIKNVAVSILTGEPVKRLKKHEKVSGNLEVPVKVPKFILGTSTKSTKETVKKLPKKKLSQLRTIAGQFYGLVPLQRLLDASLVQRVKENMGTGSRRDILNLRSGRFAESVKVERLSQSREGMITAFYNYMKNPYATFSQGGRQEFPRTRDPKLLIAKSIREIGATMVANRMRAVLV